MQRWQNGQGSMLEPIPYSSNQIELIQAKLQDLGLWLPIPAQRGVGCDWPESRVVTKKVFGFFLTGQPDCFLFLFLKG